MNWSELQERVSDAAKRAFLELHRKHPDAEIYAFVLYTDSSVMSIGSSANSIESLNEKVEQEIDDEDRTPENEAYFKWAFSEWAYDTIGGEFFKEINKDLRKSSERLDFEVFKKKVLVTMIDSLRSLTNERFFDGLSKAAGDPVIYVSMSDDDEAETIENESAEAINSKSVYERFVVRYDVG
ncbi:DUF4303 domain-containing protein [Pseudomonas sp. UBA1879]|uniref:DUF4303 domain-containing protein n=1 Tax=Pseudomonas sp. UBA1879 TaxID=1947305 RepID=UPI0025E5AB28|nr:DUF4303 domain-containing protein [Pseudomonas sp. UBA1879]